ncbi:hypothetical protein E2562_000852 [Oryza meyeriana var. granulata]|uniref:Uncharacterized protein n=1 Tax=Oryza meyeriana var. granulata TaxID=110450 RepID=A0A6G1CY45_9ORYZ|nr:hypothetical protein E2562_000852 [Oryza meyeriana var. granulata]
MGEPAPPEPSEPNPSKSNDAMANDATASDGTASDDTASDQISEEQEGSPVHPDDLLEARESPQRSPQRDDARPRPPRVDYTRYKTTGMRRLRQVPEANWFPTARDPHGTLGNIRLWTRVQKDINLAMRDKMGPGQTGLSEHQALQWTSLNAAAKGFDGTLIARKGVKEGVTTVMQWVLYHLFNRQRFDIIDLMLAEMEDVIYSAIGCQLPYGPYLFALLQTTELVNIVSYRMLPCTISTYSPASTTDRRHGDKALLVRAAGVPAANGVEEEAPRVDIPVVLASLRRQHYSSLPVGRDHVESSSSRSSDFECTVLRELTSLCSQFERHTKYVPRMMHDMWEQVQDLKETIGLPRSTPPMPRASSDRSPQEPPCPPTSTDMPTSAGVAAPFSAAVEQLTPLTGATEEDPATAGEATPASIVLPTIEDNTTVAAEVSSTAFADVDKAAGQPTPLTGATEDHLPTEEDPASTAEGDTTAPAEVSASAFPDVDEAAGRPTLLTGATEDRTPVEEDPAGTTKGDTTAPSEVSPTTIADADEAAGRPTPLTGVTEDCAPIAKDPATTTERAPTSVVVATTEEDTTAMAEVSSTIVAETDDPIATVDLAASTIVDD